MESHESYLKQSVVEISGNLLNSGRPRAQFGGDYLDLLRNLGR